MINHGHWPSALTLVGNATLVVSTRVYLYPPPQTHTRVLGYHVGVLQKLTALAAACRAATRHATAKLVHVPVPASILQAPDGAEAGSPMMVALPPGTCCILLLLPERAAAAGVHHCCSQGP
jgi:hypothetical protein